MSKDIKKDSEHPENNDILSEKKLSAKKKAALTRLERKNEREKRIRQAREALPNYFYLEVEEVAAFLRLQPNTVRKMTRGQKPVLHAVKVNGILRFERSEIVRYVNRLAGKQEAKEATEPKRKRGRPRKNPLPEQIAENKTEAVQQM